MGMFIKHIKISCNICKKYGIKYITSLYPFGGMKETNCPFCQNEIEESEPTKLEILTYENDKKLKAKGTMIPGMAIPPTLTNILLSDISDEKQ